MNKALRLSVLLLVSSLIFISCEPDQDSFDASLLVGKWRSGTLYYKYIFDGTGSTWDTGDDVSEEEGQPFTWTLSGAELKHIHIMEMGATVPKIYTVTQLNALSLRYEDDFGKQFSFTKVLF